ncbi:MAG: C25 family cysteine peptidase [Ardenticatenaceae bacterium]|nr:C25 family cysteine peptidase [Ardenticatenaceae bacterium]
MVNKKILISTIAIILLGLSVAGWRWYALNQPSSPTSKMAVAEDGTIKLEITTPGLYRITSDFLRQGGVNLESWDPTAVGLTSMGEPVPILIDGESVIFYGDGSNSVYSSYRPYLLHLAAEPDQQASMSEQPADTVSDNLPQSTVTKSVWLEENLEYSSIAYDSAYPDTWYWETIHVQNSFSFTKFLNDTVDGSGRMRIHLFGQSHDPAVENDHDLDLSINGQKITTIQWEGPTHTIADIEIPPGTLINGENEFLFDNRPEGATFIDIMLLDWVELTYKAQPTALDDQLTAAASSGLLSLTGFTDLPLTFDISNPNSPSFLTGGSFEDGRFELPLASDIKLAALGPAAPSPKVALVPLAPEPDPDPQQTDLIIVTTAELGKELDNYVDHRESQGLTVTVASIDTIYDHYGYGLPSPESIHAYLKNAWETWPSPQPQYVLLVGPSRYDYQNFLGERPVNQIPSLMIPVTHSGETVSDVRMSDVNGDFQPDMAIGRWPVETAAEVADLSARTIAYENAAPAATTIFAADGSSNEFTGLSDYLAESSGLPQNETTKLYGATAAEVSDSWNNGSWLVSYVGHGSIHLWGKDEVFSEDSIELLSANEQFAPPIVAQFTCLTGYYAHPTERSLSEQLITSSDGPVLVLGATSLTYSSHQRPFAERFLQGLHDPKFTRIGDVLLYARESLDMENTGIREVSDTFGLFGDPSAIIVRP